MSLYELYSSIVFLFNEAHGLESDGNVKGALSKYEADHYLSDDDRYFRDQVSLVYTESKNKRDHLSMQFPPRPPPLPDRISHQRSFERQRQELMGAPNQPPSYKPSSSYLNVSSAYNNAYNASSTSVNTNNGYQANQRVTSQQSQQSVSNPTQGSKNLSKFSRFISDKFSHPPVTTPNNSTPSIAQMPGGYFDDTNQQQMVNSHSAPDLNRSTSHDNSQQNASQPQRKMRTTLRGPAPPKDKKKKNNEPVASQAATLAWGSGNRQAEAETAAAAAAAAAIRSEDSHRVSSNPQSRRNDSNRPSLSNDGPLIQITPPTTPPELRSPSPTKPVNTRKKTVAQSTAQIQSSKVATKKTAPKTAPKPKYKEAEQSFDEDDSVDDSELSREEVALRNLGGQVDQELAQRILNDIVEKGDEVYWEDIAGLDAAKTALRETVIYPFLRPELYSGLREPARGMLLFGPPGTGKTMLARACATQAKSTFFNISASSVTSKYLGESEKLVRALFMLAKELSPSIVFVDEIDSLLSKRGEGSEQEASRILKTEFLVQWSTLAAAASRGNTAEMPKVLVLAATNLPWEIDEAARRRFVRRQYIPLPDTVTRYQHLSKQLAKEKHTLTEPQIRELVKLTDGYSGSDLTALAKDAAMGPLRSLGDALLTTPVDQIRPINLDDFKISLKLIRPSVSKEGLDQFEKWNKEFGSGP